MAKHCTSCNHAYPDDQAACPHCGAAAETIRPVAPGSSPDIILGDQSIAEASDSDLVPVITDEGSSATQFDRTEGSSMDIDLGQAGPGDSSALIVGAAADQGSPSDVMDVDFSSVADSSSSHPPLVAEPAAPSSATAEPNPGASDDASGLTVGEPEALAGFGSGSSLEIEAVAPAETVPAEASDPSAEVVGHEEMAAVEETSDSSAVDLGSYRDENADAEKAAAGASSSWDTLKESGELVGAGTAAPAGEIIPQERSSRGWMGGGAAGLLAGAAASVALWTFGVEPPQALRGLVGTKKATVTQVQPVSSGQSAQRTPEQPPAAAVQPPPAPTTPAKKTDDDALAKVATALRGDADVQKHDPQLKTVDQDVQLVMQGKKQARAELDAVRKAVAALGQTKGPASLADAVTRAMQKAKTIENQLAAVGRAVGLKNADEPVAPAVEKLLADQQAAKKQLASIAHQAAADKALIQAAVHRLTAAKLLPDGAGADKLLGSMDRLLTAGPSPVATTLDGVATGLGEVSGAATQGASSVVNATGHLAVDSLHNTLAALSQPHRPGVVTTTVLHQPAEDKVALQLPQSLGTYQPEAAVKHFSAGYQSYWSGDPDQAAREFQAAIQNDRDDARYCYFLGLTLLQQSRQAAAVRAIRQGALLEKQGLPDTSAVNLALERVQGPMRELLDLYRR